MQRIPSIGLVAIGHGNWTNSKSNFYILHTNSSNKFEKISKSISAKEPNNALDLSGVIEETLLALEHDSIKDKRIGIFIHSNPSIDSEEKDELTKLVQTQFPGSTFEFLDLGLECLVAADKKLKKKTIDLAFCVFESSKQEFETGAKWVSLIFQPSTKVSKTYGSLWIYDQSINSGSYSDSSKKFQAWLLKVVQNMSSLDPLESFDKTWKCNQNGIGITVELLFEKQPKKSATFKENFQKTQAQEEFDFWRNQITKISEQCQLFDPKFQEMKHSQKKNLVQVSSNLYSTLLKVSKTYSLTLNIIFQFTWHQVLHIFKRNGFGSTTVAGIQISNGLFRNFVPLILHHSDSRNESKTLVGMLQDLEKHLRELNSRSTSIELSDILNFANPPISLESIVLCEKAPISKMDYPIILNILEDPTNSTIDIQLVYQSDLIPCEQIEVMIETAICVLDQIAFQPLVPFVHLKWVQETKPEWSTKTMDFNRPKLLHTLVEEAAFKSPEKICLVYNGSKITFETLNQKANQIAWSLRDNYDIQSEDLIPIFLERDENLIISILGILKAGGAYVPIDTAFPDQRISYIVQDTGAKLVLTNEIHAKKLKSILGMSVKVEAIDAIEFVEQAENCDGTNLNLKDVKADNLAYCIYTSGTTGNPKGVLVEHQSIVNSINSHAHIFFEVQALEKSGEKVKQTIFSSVAFDAFLCELFCTVICGGEFHLLSDPVRFNPHLLSDYLVENQITHIELVPAMLAVLPQNINYPNLKKICYGGDECKQEIAAFWSRKVQLFNGYGPTETSSVVTGGYVDGTNMRDIGIPYHNSACYILDTNFNFLPPLAVGELLIGGPGLARGYLNNPHETRSKFIKWKKPTKTLDCESSTIRLYRTGDLARWSLRGRIEFFGRNDNQVKVRGYRIELSEIERSLEKVEGIGSCVTVVVQNSIVAYVVLDANYTSHERTIEILKLSLPTYMIPTSIIEIPSIPLKPNGKIDYSALPVQNYKDNRNSSMIDEMSNANQSETNIVQPRNDLESEIAEIFASVLNVQEIGITDDFFKLGGDSIGCIQVIGAIHEFLGLVITMQDIFDHKTIKNLYDYVISALVSNSQGVLNDEQDLLEESSGSAFSLSAIQQWKLKFLHPHNSNQSISVRVPNQLDLVRLREAVVQIYNHHDGLRLIIDKNSLNQRYTEFSIEALDNLEVLDVSRKERREINNWQSSSFDAIEGSLSKFRYIHGYPDGSTRIIAKFHPLLIDSTSCEIVFRDLESIYNGQTLPPKGTSYRQWISLVDKSYEPQIPYWTEIMEGCSKWNSYLEQGFFLLQLSPTPIKEILKLTKTQTSLLFGSPVHKIYNTDGNDLILSAIGLMLSNLFDESTNYIAVNGQCRELSLEGGQRVDFNNTVGQFSTIYPFRLESVPNDLAQTVINVKESLRKVPDNGIGYAQLFECNQLNLPRISFKFLDQLSTRQNSNITNESWTFSAENCVAENPIEDILSILAAVVEDELRFTVYTRLDTEISSLLHESISDLCSHLEKEPRTYLTLSDIDYIISQEYLNNLQKSEEIESIFLANSLQEGFIYHALLRGENETIADANNIHTKCTFHQEINESLYRESWERMLVLYPALRLKFGWKEKCIQIIPKRASLDFRYFDLVKEREHLCTDERRVITQEIIDAEKKEGYKLDQGKLFRVILIREDDSEYTNLFGWHHSILDGWSLNVLLSRVQEVYSNFVNGLGAENLEIDSSYSDSQKFYQKNCNLNLSWWENEILKINPRNEMLGLISDSARNEPSIISHAQKVELELPVNLFGKLKQMSKSNGITLNAIIQFTWHQILHIFGIPGVNSTVSGTVVSGRNIPIPGIKSSVGLFINTLPLIVNHEEIQGGSILEALKIIQSQVNELNGRSTIPLAKIVDLANGNEIRRSRIFDSILTFQNYPNSLNREGDAELRWFLDEVTQTLDYPIVLTCTEIGDTLEIYFEYSLNFFKSEGIQVMRETFLHILYQVGKDPKKPMSQLTFVRGDKIFKQLELISYHGPKVLHGFVEEAAFKHPGKVGLTFNAIKMSYTTLNYKANQIARCLRDNYGIRREDLIPIFLERDENLIIGLLGILKAGGAYVPIDTSFPDQRISYIVQDTATKLVLTNEIHLKKLRSLLGKGVQVVAIDSIEFIEEMGNYDGSNLNVEDVGTSNLAYCIYTSGTTGNPKGVLIEHQSIVNSLNSHAQIFFEVQALQKTGEKVKQTIFSSVACDAFLYELFSTVICAGEVHLLSDTVRLNPHLLSDYLIENEITNMDIVPAMLATLPRNVDYPNLKKIVYGGEECKTDVGAFWSSKVQLFNSYGPTEASVAATGGFIDGTNMRDIGVPYHNTICYILDTNLNLLPKLAIGELCIGGLGLARGYLNNPQETESKFITWRLPSETTFSTLRLYRTGDLARWTSNGNLEYFGRNDNQVNIRGYRVELGEIERTLEKVEGIRSSVVQLIKDSIIAYIVVDARCQLYQSHETTIQILRSQLPSYMIPSSIIEIPTIPITPNGKIDYSALPIPQSSSLTQLNLTIEEPRNEFEVQFRKIWSGVLGIDSEQIGVTTSFFELGGNSIKSIVLIGQTKQKIGITLSLKDIFEQKTIRKLCEKVTTEESNFLLPRTTDIADFTPYVPIIEKRSDDSKKKILFCLPSGIGGAENYIGTLVPALKTSLDLILFNNFLSHWSKVNPSPTIGSLATEHIVHMKRVQADGPYNVFGWSVGGIIGFEICRQLLLLGDQVGSLVLIDPFFKLRESYKKFDSTAPDPKDFVETAMINYQPPFTGELFKNTRVLLFKAKTAVDQEDDPITNHYTNETQFNYLDKLIPERLIQPYSITDHLTWIKSSKELVEISDILRKEILLST